MPHLLRFWLALPVLAPLVIWQGLRLRKDAPRLPAILGDTAAGSEPGGTGGTDELRVLVVGESTAVGVGATAAGNAMAPRLAAALAGCLGRSVRWQVVGENGIRAGQLAGKLDRHRDLLTADFALVLLGANDSSGLTSLGVWRRDLGRVISVLKLYCRHVVIAPVPPFHRFVLLPQPLRWLLGERALALCAARRELAEPDRVVVIEAEFPTAPRYLASDGYHPSDIAYREWADQVSNIIENNILNNLSQVDYMIFNPDRADREDR